MSMVDRLIDQLAARGMRVVPGEAPGELKLAGETKNADDATWKALRLFKPLLLERFAGREAKPAPVPVQEPQPEEEPEPLLCELCERDVTDPVDREALATNPLLCDRGGAWVKGGQPIPRCPWKSEARG